MYLIKFNSKHFKKIPKKQTKKKPNNPSQKKNPKQIKPPKPNQNKLQYKIKLKSTNILPQKYQKHHKINLKSLFSHLPSRTTGHIWRL